MNTVERDRQAYKLAKDHLFSFQQDGVTESIVEKYINYSRQRPHSIEGVYKHLLFSAQNAGMKTGVIGKAIGGVDKLGCILVEFNPTRVKEHYGDDWKKVLNDVRRVLKPRGKMRRTPRAIWPQYCRTILSAANFMTQFKSADDFYSWVDVFDKDYRVRPALPMLLSHEVEGIGFALACDFLKEMGYINYAKPDSQIRAIFTGIGLCPPNADNFQLFKAVIRVAESVGVSSYNVDKLFWLVGSGRFYDDPSIGRKGKVKTNKQKFIAQAKRLLSAGITKR